MCITVYIGFSWEARVWHGSHTRVGCGVRLGRGCTQVPHDFLFSLQVFDLAYPTFHSDTHTERDREREREIPMELMSQKYSEDNFLVIPNY